MNKYLVKFSLFFSLLTETILSVLKAVLLSKRLYRSVEFIDINELLILGNGPSLKETLERNSIFIRNKVLCCVNFFPLDELYDIYKPNIYIIGAPELWRTNVDKKYIENSNKLFKAISKKTYWDLVLFIPVEAKRFPKWKGIIENNKCIKIQYYNNTPIKGFKWFTELMLRNNLGIPRPHNILIPALITGINLGFKQIFIVGSEHSWLDEISVNSDNQVLLNQKHFYDLDSSKPTPMHMNGRGNRKLHEVLLKFVFTFEGYFVIDNYAQCLGVNIYNCTPYSYIDAFKRLNIEQLNNNERSK